MISMLLLRSSHLQLNSIPLLVLVRVEVLNFPGTNMLLQETYQGNPWKMMICCILLNQTTSKQVKGILKELFTHYPDAIDMSEGHLNDIAEIVKPCGLQNKRALSLKTFSEQWCTFDSNTPIIKYYGIGGYAEDSWNIFVEGKIDEYVQ